MRKLITAFLILALMLSLSFTLISCGEGGEETKITVQLAFPTFRDIRKKR